MTSSDNEIEDNEKTMHDIQKHIKTINSYQKLKPQLEKFRNVDPDSLSGQELTRYRSFRSRWRYAYKMFESSREKYGTLSTKS
ncbi:MAG: hypothetical protein LUD81_08425 [Clostridiales bacterium]|nr:hypothetical protein [Clostridiales bacterium]